MKLSPKELLKSELYGTGVSAKASSTVESVTVDIPAQEVCC